MRLAILLGIFLVLPLLTFAQKYEGPAPEKEDLLYLVQADNLIPAEALTAQEQKGKKDEITYFMPGAASSAKTPLASPVFLVKAKELTPEKLQLYKLDVRNGRREITFRNGKRVKNPDPFHVNVKRLGEGLYRLEVSDSLANGQYSFTPEGSDAVFCFEVY
jgi:hypothetical protein